MNWNEKTVLVTGSKGFLGSFLVKELEKLCPKKIITPSSKELDLRDNSNCNKIVRGVDIVFHLAGRGGGIGFMRKNPADAFYDNILMSMHTLFAAGGPDFQNGIISEPFENIHLYPMIAHILDIEPNPEIDGKIDNIRHLLR